MNSERFDTLLYFIPVQMTYVTEKPKRGLALVPAIPPGYEDFTLLLGFECIAKLQNNVRSERSHVEDRASAIVDLCLDVGPNVLGGFSASLVDDDAIDGIPVLEVGLYAVELALYPLVIVVAPKEDPSDRSHCYSPKDRVKALDTQDPVASWWMALWQHGHLSTDIS
jgi:hypothetical protein